MRVLACVASFNFFSFEKLDFSKQRIMIATKIQPLAQSASKLPIYRSNNMPALQDKHY